MKILIYLFLGSLNFSSYAQHIDNGLKESADTIRILAEYDDWIKIRNDWPDLSHYKNSNEKLRLESNPASRIVFIGNSITDFWPQNSPDFFKNNNFIGRGIKGQTSPQMLVRFRADVINIKPVAVVIECGTNDIAGNTGPSTLEMIKDNIMSMAELAKFNKIKVILGSVLPANEFYWSPEMQPADKIIALNAWIKEYANKNGMIYLDYYSSLVDDKKGMKSEYSGDGVHPNKAGYRIMEKLIEESILKIGIQ